MKPFEKIGTTNVELNRLQDNLARFLRPIELNKMLDGVHLRSVTLVTGSNDVPHLLGRKLLGWIPTRMRAGALIYDTNDSLSSAQQEQFLQLVTSADVTVDLWVF